MEAAVAVERVGEVGAVGRMFELIGFEFFAGGEGELVGGVEEGVERDVCEFAGVKAVRPGDFLKEAQRVCAAVIGEGRRFQQFVRLMITRLIRGL